MSSTAGQPDVRLKRVYAAPAAADGTRILVDRIWPRGLRKEEAAVDLWLKDIAPSTALRQWFAHDASRWHDFVTRYHDELAHNGGAVEALVAALVKGAATLLCAARDEQHNNAVALADYLIAHRHLTRRQLRDAAP
jgi:uncharacterized protein YeaO (DUF488 family)